MHVLIRQKSERLEFRLSLVPPLTRHLRVFCKHLQTGERNCLFTVKTFVYMWVACISIRHLKTAHASFTSLLLLLFHFKKLFWLECVTNTLKVTAKTLNPQDECLRAAGKLQLISLDLKTKTTAWHKSKVQSMLMHKWNGKSQNSSINMLESYERERRRAREGEKNQSEAITDLIRAFCMKVQLSYLPPICIITQRAILIS